jgi:hypothetical protein
MKIVAVIMAALLALTPTLSVAQTQSNVPTDEQLVKLGAAYAAEFKPSSACYNQLLNNPVDAPLSANAADVYERNGRLGAAVYMLLVSTSYREQLQQSFATLKAQYQAGQITAEKANAAAAYYQNEYDKAGNVIIAVLSLYPACNFDK